MHGAVVDVVFDFEPRLPGRLRQRLRVERSEGGKFGEMRVLLLRVKRPNHRNACKLRAQHAVFTSNECGVATQKHIVKDVLSHHRSLYETNMRRV